MTTTTPPYLPDLIGWDVRHPTFEESVAVDRLEVLLHTADPYQGDRVVVIDADDETLAAFARFIEGCRKCNRAHVIPGGVYAEDLWK